MSNEFKHILNYLDTMYGFNFSVCRYSSLEYKINNRMAFLKIDNTRTYIQYIEQNPGEINILIDLLTINVSRFFRNTLTFEYLAKRKLREEELLITNIDTFARSITFILPTVKLMDYREKRRLNKLIRENILQAA